MTSKPTSGPWYVDGIDAETSQINVIGDGFYVCGVIAGLESQGANARLIAAAPDLSEAAKRARRDLAAIKKFAEWCHDSPASLAGHINEGLPSITASIAALDAAIAKAAGEVA